LRLRRIKLLARDRIFFDKRGVALEIEASVFELCLILSPFGYRLIETGLIDARINLDENVASFQLLT
jgi:hypothetical protein